MNSLKLRRIGDTVVVTIPDDVLGHLSLKEGDSLSLALNADGITLTPEISAEDLAGTERIMQRYDAVLKRLAR